MPPSVRARLATLGAVVALSAGVLAACSDDADQAADPDRSGGPSGSSSVTGVTGATCGDAIPDTVMQALAWQATGVGEAHVGRCQRAATQGRVVVGTIATVDGAQDTYDARCATLPGDPGATEVDWLGDRTACAASPDAASGPVAGVTEVYVLDGQSVVQVRIEALQPVSTAALHAGVSTLLDATEPVLDRF